VLTALGDLAQAQGDAGHALACYQESLTLHAKIGNKLGVAACFAGLAQRASTQGQPEQVARLLGAAAARICCAFDDCRIRSRCSSCQSSCSRANAGFSD